MAKPTRKNLSELELEVLRYLASAGPRTVREAAEGFGAANGYARTTVLTIMERLRQKGYVTRENKSGAFRYSSSVGPGELMRGVVGRFVARALGGSVSPLVAYLTENPHLSDKEIEQLRLLVESLSKEVGQR